MELFTNLIKSKYFYYILASYGFMFITLFILLLRSYKAKINNIQKIRQQYKETNS